MDWGMGCRAGNPLLMMGFQWFSSEKHLGKNASWHGKYVRRKHMIIGWKQCVKRFFFPDLEFGPKTSFNSPKRHKMAGRWHSDTARCTFESCVFFRRKGRLLGLSW